VLRFIFLVGLILSVSTIASVPASFAGESSVETATACLKHIQKLSLLGPELVCLDPTPRVVRLQKLAA
jgi:hypothetical protein